MEKLTLKDIAEKAGVSMMTVSNVINGKSSRVSAQTAEKINKIIEDCGYIPNLSARSLTKKSSNIIGVIVTVYDADRNYLENPYISTMIGIIEQELCKNGYYMMIRSVKNESDVLQFLKNWNLDGMILLFPDFIESVDKFIVKSSCPIVIFDSPIQLPKLITVCSDDRKGMYLATKYMINRGHTHIAFVADYKGNYILTERFLGYRQALEECGIPFREEYVLAYPATYEGGLAAGKRIAAMRNHLSAVVTTADICAVGVMEGARLGGLRIPVDLSITGYDNLSLCQFTTPKLTSVSQNIAQKAQVATQLLLEKMLAETEKDQPTHVMMDVEIVERQSVIALF